MGANDIAIVEDMEDFRIGDYLGTKPCLIQGLSHQHPALKSSVRPDRSEERSKVISALNTLWIEDPSLSFSGEGACGAFCVPSHFYLLTL